jgi:hypothetical protein
MSEANPSRTKAEESASKVAELILKLQEDSNF